MARPPVLPNDEIKKYVDEFFAVECNYEPSKLKITDISQYIINKGYNVQASTLRRNKEIKEYIEKLKKKSEKSCEKTVAVFRILDIDAFLNTHPSKTSLREALLERENYFKEVCNSAAVAFKEQKKLKANITKKNENIANLKYDNKKLEEEVNKLKDNIKELNNTVHDLKCKNKGLRGIIDDYVNPEIANELLVKDGLLENTAGYLKENIVDDKIVGFNSDVTPIKNNVVKGLFDIL